MDTSLGAVGALGALGFWLFLAAVVVAGVWHAIREKETEHETLRRAIESGQAVDPRLMNKISGGDKRPDRDLKIAGLIILSLAPGLVALGWFLGEETLMLLIGVAILMACLGLGFLAAAKVAERSYRENDSAALDRTRGP